MRPAPDHPRCSDSREKSICEMSLAAAHWGSEKGEWSNDQLRWDAKEQEYKAEALTCRFGGGCRQGLNCPYRHSQEEIQIFVDERELRRRKLMIRCGFCARGECKFEGCCARTIRAAAASKDQADSDYESGSADSEGGDIGLAGEGVSDEDDGWLTQSSKGGSVSSDEGAYWSGGEGDDGCSDGGRFAALGVGTERRRSCSWAGLLGGEADFRFVGGKTRRERAAEKKAAAAARDEAVVAAVLAEVDAACAARARGEAKVQTAGARDRARAGWDRVRIAVSELSWRRFRRVFRKKRRVAVEGPVLTVELVGTVLWMAWERARDGLFNTGSTPNGIKSQEETCIQRY